MIASLLCFDVLHLSPKTLVLREKPFLARLTSHNLAGFEVRAVKASSDHRVAEASSLALQLRGSGKRGGWVAMFTNNGRSKPQRSQKVCVNSEDEKWPPLGS